MPNAPDISIAILVRNGMPRLRDLLTALPRQQGCGSMEIVAVDSASTDGSLKALEDAGARVEGIDPKNFRFGPTRQHLFGLTRGRVIVTISQDAVPVGPHWLERMTRPILDGEIDLAMANQAAPWGIQQKLNVQQNGFTYADFPAPFSAASCAGLAISRAGWDATGFGDVVMSEDKYLAKKASEQNLRARFVDEAILNHGHDYTPTSYVKRAFNEGMGARATFGRYPFKQMVRDLSAVWIYKYAVSGLIKHRFMTIADVVTLPLRPIFLWIGYRFGTGYWR